MLASYAAKPELAKREYTEVISDYKNAFQCDRDRIIHSKYFRRLMYKTQVFVNHLGDNFRTRLTHSIEVAQVSRNVARALNLNEDLCEVIALAHDLGHPPFGHAGEFVMRDLLSDEGGFNHNDQSLRIVTKLENRYIGFRGLNLTDFALLGMQKHSHKVAHTAEAQVVDICDSIAYNCHDLEDAFETNLFTIDMLQEVEIWQQHWKGIVSNEPEKLKIRTAIRGILNYFIRDLISQSMANLEKHRIESLDDVYAFKTNNKKENLIDHSPEVKRKKKQLRNLLFQSMYRHPQLLKSHDNAKQTISGIFEALKTDISLLPENYRERLKSHSEIEVITDFIAGMTDRYAISWHEQNGTV